MKRSSIKKGRLVKPNVKEQQQLLETLAIDFKKVVKEGVHEYIAEGTRLLIKLFHGIGS